MKNINRFIWKAITVNSELQKLKRDSYNYCTAPIIEIMWRKFTTTIVETNHIASETVHVRGYFTHLSPLRTNKK